MTVGAEPSGRTASRADVQRTNVRPPLWRELCLGLALFGVYTLVEAFSSRSRDIAARHHGEQILVFERALHIDLETPLNEWLARYPTLQVFANYEYAITYIVSALWLLGWLYRRRPEVYRWARDSFLLLNLIAFGCFALYPTAPPRLLGGEGFVDTVRVGDTWLSWGSPLVRSANQIAAMPSLHVAWALWVSVVLACVSGRRWVQAASAVHVLVTVFVVLATANHYLLDVVGAAVAIWLALAVMSIFQDRPGQGQAPRVAPADAFFLHAESASWPQHVGGVIVVDGPGDPRAYHERTKVRIEETLPLLPRFTQRLWWPSRWRRPRWIATDAIDWDWHVPLWDLSEPDGRPAGYDALWQRVARLQAESMPRDRPLWRWIVVTGFAEDKAAALFLMHHSVADGIGTVAQALRLFEPEPPLATEAPPSIGSLKRAVGIVAGLAQLATDGRARGELPNTECADRHFAGLSIPMSRMREIARRRHARVTDLLLTMIVSAMREALGDRPEPSRLRIAVPLMVRTPESTAEGNVTAAVITDAPLTDLAEPERLAAIAQRSRRLRSGTRPLASRFVLSTGVALLPQPAQAWFARTVYGHRFFQAIVSNMPGPVGPFAMVGATISAVFPILPLASRAPLVVGALSWDDVLHIGFSAEPAFVADMEAFLASTQRTLDRLAEPDVTPDLASSVPHASEPTRSGA